MGTVNEHIPERLAFALESQKIGYCEDLDRKMLHEYGVYVNSECVKIVDRVRLLPGSVIGFKGFSWGFHEDLRPEEIRHLGGVIIGNRVEIGANCTVARATLRGTYTIIGDDTKLDSHVHVAHNCVIGERCMLAAGVVLSGSVTIGDDSWLAPNCTVMNGVTLGKHNLIGLGATVRKDTEDGAVIYGEHKIMKGGR